MVPWLDIIVDCFHSVNNTFNGISIALVSLLSLLG